MHIRARILGFLLLPALFCASDALALDPPGEPADLPGAEVAIVIAGESSSLVIGNLSQVLIGNTVIESGIDHSATIENAFNGNTGIFNVNQDAGNFNNQANLRAFVVNLGEPMTHVLSVSVESIEEDNEIDATDVTYQDRIAGSFNNNVGVIGVNQTSGSLNQQRNVLVTALGFTLSPEIEVITDIDLDHVRSDNGDTNPQPPATDSIVDSFGGNTGIVQATQATGNQNVLTNVIAISIGVLPEAIQ